MHCPSLLHVCPPRDHCCDCGAIQTIECLPNLAMQSPRPDRPDNTAGFYTEPLAVQKLVFISLCVCHDSFQMSVSTQRFISWSKSEAKSSDRSKNGAAKILQPPNRALHIAHAMLI